MKKIVLISVYFGKIKKEQIQLWLKTCKNNPTINWLFVTDIKMPEKLPKNIKIINFSLKSFANLARKKIHPDINIYSAYKLCDYKPAYGFLLSDYIKEYDYWGHFDISDSIFGDIRHFLTDNLLEKNEKTGFLGHLTVYKNNEETNNRIFLKSDDNESFLDILLSKENMAFDELGPFNINKIYQDNKINIGRIDNMYVDVSPIYYPFKTATYDKQFKRSENDDTPFIMMWEKGKLFKVTLLNGEIEKKEYLYVHYQKRNMKYSIPAISDLDKYYITPNGFELLDERFIKKNLRVYGRHKLIYPPFFKLKSKALKYKIKKLIQKKRNKKCLAEK